jgi:hypothetical protein
MGHVRGFAIGNVVMIAPLMHQNRNRLSGRIAD